MTIITWLLIVKELEGTRICSGISNYDAKSKCTTLKHAGLFNCGSLVPAPPSPSPSQYQHQFNY